MKIASTHPIASNDSRYVSSCQLYSHYQTEETGRPGIICIVCHPVLRYTLEHGPSSMKKHLLAKAQILKFNELTESEVIALTSSMVKETGSAILKRQRNSVFTIVNSLR
jgi:hypothetical protein